MLPNESTSPGLLNIKNFAMYFVDSRASWAIQALIAFYMLFCFLHITLDIWSIYLEMHLNMIAEWVNNVKRIVPEPMSKLMLVGHLFLCCVQSIALCVLLSATAEKMFKRYYFGLRALGTLLMIEYGVFFGYVVSTWNHYQYIFITFTFIAIAYKTVLCWPLLEFEKELRIFDKANKCNNNPSNEENIDMDMTSGLLSAEVLPAIEAHRDNIV